jgi:hypothetical protein
LEEDGCSTFLENIHEHVMDYAGFEVLTAVVMKSSIFWDIMPCGPLEVN